MGASPHIDSQDLEVLPIERSETIPSLWYTDPAFHSFEREALFSQTWQYLGSMEHLEQPGDQVPGSAGGNPVLAVRGQDAVLRAFYNVCRHRGGPLATSHCNTKVLQCKYHGWTYLLDGSLRGTPRFDRTELFDKKDFGLTPIRIDTWQGLAFLNLATGGLPLETVLKGIVEKIAPIRIAGKKFFRRVSYDVNCNWKVYVDNYLEGYHLPYVHPELCNLLDFQNYRTETFEHYSLQHSPLQQSAGIYEGDGPAYYFFVWPNFMLNILPGRLQTNLVVPTSHRTCKVHFDYYYDDVQGGRANQKAEEDLKYSDRVQEEDIEICEHVQRGLESAAYDKGRFSPEMENGVHHFQSLLKRAYRKALQR
jgi:choline monooxygenase